MCEAVAHTQMLGTIVTKERITIIAKKSKYGY
jgi:hypothetical protein